MLLLLLTNEDSILADVALATGWTCALSEDTARVIGAKVLQQWSRDPRPQAHHRITAALLQPGAFIDALKSWVDGASFSSLPLTFQEKVAELRFIPIVETTIEEKHARVSLAKSRHHIGPVRVSLANRLPLLERWLKRGQVSAAKLLECFNQARSLKAVPALLNIDDHPSLGATAVSKRPAQLRPPRYDCSWRF